MPDRPTIDPITEPTQVVSPVSEDDGASPGADRVAGRLRRTRRRSARSGHRWHRRPAAPAGRAAEPAGDSPASAPDVAGDRRRRPGAGASDDADGEELFESTKPRPTGADPVGRARRNGLLPARMRAKRPDDVDVVTDTPLAAEPPGASVTDVPGVGLKRGGVAGLAAADRSAERDGEAQGRRQPSRPR